MANNRYVFKKVIFKQEFTVNYTSVPIDQIQYNLNHDNNIEREI